MFVKLRNIERVVAAVEQTFVDKGLSSTLLYEIEVNSQDADALFVESPDERNEVAVACDERRNVNLAIESNLKSVHGQGDICSLFPLVLRYGQVLRFHSSVHKVMVMIAVKAKMFQCGIF